MNYLHFRLDTRHMMRTFIIMLVSVVLLTQSTVSAQSATLAGNELKDLVTKMKTEVDRRLSSTDSAIAALQSSNAVSSTAKGTVSAALTASKKSLDDYKKQLAGITDLTSAQSLADAIDKQYDSFASASASALSLKDGDGQQQVFQQMTKLAQDAQSMIDVAGSAGMDIANLQEQLKGLDQLVESIGGIVSSVMALIIALSTGNFTKAATLFQTILGQLAQNLVAIGTAQSGLNSVVDTLGGLNIKVGDIGKSS